MMKNQIQAFFLATGMLLAGMLIYLAEKDQAGFIAWLHIQRVIPASAVQFDFPGWVTGSLPDGLWMGALMICILAIWDFRLQRMTWYWIGLAFAAGLGFEFAQRLHWIRGTYDQTDILWLCLGGMAPILVRIILSACKPVPALSPRQPV